MKTDSAPGIVPGAGFQTTGERMKVTIVRQTVAGGFDLKVGDTVELSSEDAMQLIAMGKAVHPAEAAPKVENREGAVKKRRSTRKK